MVIDPLLSLGAVRGVVVGLTGLGGAAIVTPMLLLLFNIPAPVAVSTDLVSAAVMKPVGGGVPHRPANPHYQSGPRLVAGVRAGSVAGDVAVLADRGDGVRRDTLKRIIGVVLLVAVVVSLIRMRLRRFQEAHAVESLNFSTGRPVASGVVGLVVGILVDLTSVGSGTLIAASLLIIFPAMLPSRLVGTDLVQAIPMLIVGALATCPWARWTGRSWSRC